VETYLTVDDLVKALKVTPVWIYKLVREKRIPFVHVERCVRFSPSAIEAWLKERENKEWSLGVRKREQR
jgi:excisionase family DNA binding protein